MSGDDIIEWEQPAYEQRFEWKPKTKERPRAQPGGKGRSFTPKATRDAEAAILAQYEGPCFEGPISVVVHLHADHFDLRIFEREAPSKKWAGDLDNYLKLITDALNGHAYVDDKQIVTLVGVKN